MAVRDAVHSNSNSHALRGRLKPAPRLRASRPQPRVHYLELSEDAQTRYDLPQYPSCTPEADFVSQSNSREEIDALIRLLPEEMQQFLLAHDMKSEVRNLLQDMCQVPPCDESAPLRTCKASTVLWPMP